MKDDEESLLDLANYNDLNSKYEEYLSNQNNPGGNTNVDTPKDGNNNLVTIIIVASCTIVVAVGVVAGFVIYRKKKVGGGR